MNFRKLFLFIIVLNLFAILSSDVIASEIKNERDSLFSLDSMTQDLARKNAIYYQPWRSSIYLAATYGYPQGLRFDLGYNIINIVSIGLSYGTFDFWSRDPKQGTIGITGKINIPLRWSRLTPYMLIGGGGTISIFGGSDDFTIFALGVIYPIENWLQFRPELCVVFTSKHISGGSGIFGSSPEVKEHKTLIGLNLAIELDIMRLFD